MSSEQTIESEVLVPSVDQAREFLEIANDFANPLDIVREAVSNAYDAKATNIGILFDVIQQYGEPVLRIIIEDDGEGMDREGLQAFFDLGNSTRRNKRTEDPSLIGEKGHGTKIYFNSDRVDVETTDGLRILHATMERPFASLHQGALPTATLHRRLNEEMFKGTRIEILGYNRSRRDMFTQAQLKDHIQWFTKHGSVESYFRDPVGKDTIIRLKGIDVTDEERVQFGHPFPSESAPVGDLLQQYNVDAPQYFSKRWIQSGSLANFPEIKYEMVFAVEGDRVKREWNKMLRGRGRAPLPGMYQVQERYGLWLTKDYIPIQRKNEWVTSRDSEFTKFHAFLNCQSLKLTANRGSIENTPTEIIDALETAARSLYKQIEETDEWTEWHG